MIYRQTRQIILMVSVFPKTTAQMGHKYKINQQTPLNYAIIYKTLVKHQPMVLPFRIYIL